MSVSVFFLKKYFFVLSFQIFQYCPITDSEQVEGPKRNVRGKKTWNECVKVDMKKLGLVKDNAQNRIKWRNLTTGNRPTLPQCGYEGVIFMDCVIVT